METYRPSTTHRIGSTEGAPRGLGGLFRPDIDCTCQRGGTRIAGRPRASFCMAPADVSTQSVVSGCGSSPHKAKSLFALGPHRHLPRPVPSNTKQSAVLPPGTCLTSTFTTVAPKSHITRATEGCVAHIQTSLLS